MVEILTGLGASGGRNIISGRCSGNGIDACSDAVPVATYFSSAFLRFGRIQSGRGKWHV
jgi:hypothetical protein